MNQTERLMHRFLTDVVAGGKLELLDELSLPDMIDEANELFDGPRGRAGLIAHVKGFRKNIADPTVSIQRIVGNDSEVMSWWEFEGKHVGPWLNLSPTHEMISATVFSFFSIENQRIKRYQLWLHANVNPPQVFDGRIKREFP